MISVIDLVAYFVNFGVLLGICVYLFKTYAVSMLRQEIASEELHRITVNKRLELLKKQNKNLFLAGEHQQMLYENLNRKIEQWNHSVIAQQQRSIQEYQSIEEQIQKRSEQLFQQQTSERLHALVLPQAIEQARQELERCFDQQKVHTYNEYILMHMRKARSCH